MRNTVWVICAVSCFWGCGDASRVTEQAHEAMPRVVLVTLDTLHVEFTSVHNTEIDFTPALSHFADEGVVFTQARTTVPMTLPAHSSLLSGRTPLDLGVLENGVYVPEGMESLARVFESSGYRTGAFLSLATLRRQHGLDKGFEIYDDGYGTVPRSYRTADEILAEVLPWLKQNQDAPYFAWIHFSDPHEPYIIKPAPPDIAIELDGTEITRVSLTSQERHELELVLLPGRHTLRWSSLRETRDDDLKQTTQFLRLPRNPNLEGYVLNEDDDLSEAEIAPDRPFDLRLHNPGESAVEILVGFEGGLRKPPRSEVLEGYRAEIEFMDRRLGELKAAVEADGVPVLWVVVSDHGEGLYLKKRVLGHAGFGMEHQLRILWMMKGPGVPAGIRLDDVPALIHDVAPTILDLVGLPALTSAEGISLVGCWQGGQCPDERSWIAHGVNPKLNRVSAVAAYDWPLKLLRQERPGSGGYDLSEDPWEHTNLNDREELRAQMDGLADEIEATSAELARRLGASHNQLSEEDRAVLRSLGYLN